MAICRLCEQDRTLIDAHIIPRWAYDFLYPENEKGKSSLILAGKNFNKRRPIGSYDPNILCAECDNYLGVFDDYGKQILLDEKLEPYSKSKLAHKLSNVDIEKLRKFLVSVVWRASISKKGDFDSVNIGPYENKIRNILLSKEAVNTDTKLFDFVISKFDPGKYPEITEKNIMVPFMTRIDEGKKVCLLYFPNGIKIVVKIDRQEFSTKLSKLSANNNPKELIIPILGEFEGSPEFNMLLSTF